MLSRLAGRPSILRCCRLTGVWPILHPQPSAFSTCSRRLRCPPSAGAQLHTMATPLASLEEKTAALQVAGLAGDELGTSMLTRTDLSTILCAHDGGASMVGREVVVGGWVRTGREAGAGAEEPWAFLELSDGSCFGSLQVLVAKSLADTAGGMKALVPTSTSLLLRGVLVESPAKGQKVELRAKAIVYVGVCDAAKYPLAKKAQTFEYLREKAHLRPRTNTISAVARIRHTLALATHTFFDTQGFRYVHTPVITASDAEGAGELFQVTTLASKIEEVEKTPALSEEDMAALRERAAKGQPPDSPEAKKAAEEVTGLLRLKEQLALAEERAKMQGGLPRTAQGRVDYARDFFGLPAYLTCSGQLQAEYYACAMSKVYTFGPTFRAENSHTARHLAEFWMIEPEMAWCDLKGDMLLAEQYVQFCCRFLLDRCRPDLEFFASGLGKKSVDPQCIERLQAVASTPFKRLSYTEAVEILEGVIRDKKKKFVYPVSWGADLQSEHERYLTEEVFKQPVIVYDYPKGIKAFYMRLNDDGRTVAAMDVLVPKVGELIGGSQREERLEMLQQRIQDAGLPMSVYDTYLDLRRYGTVPHAGFGLGFERLILFATGLDNIREVIPFPRWPGHAEF